MGMSYIKMCQFSRGIHLLSFQNGILFQQKNIPEKLKVGFQIQLVFPAFLDVILHLFDKEDVGI